MALAGILSIFQAWLIPGFLFLLFFRNIKILDNLVLSIPLSLVINYILIYVLVNLNAYTQSNFFIIILFEFFLICLILIRRYSFNVLVNEVDSFFSIKKKKKLININFSLINLIIFLLLIIYAFYALKNLGQPVHAGDPLDMWNAWAISWSKNEIPYNVEYPQAVPILYSISYVLLASYEVEYFTSAVCLIYPIWIFVIFFRLTYLFPEKKLLIKLSLIITTFFLLSILRNYSLFIGYSDPILVLTSTSAGYIFLYFFHKKKNDLAHKINLKDIILISLIAASPAITKQMGLLVSFMFPVFYFLINYLDNKLLYKNFIIIASIIFVISISWYVFPIYHYYQIDFESTKFARLSASAMMGSENSNLFMKLDYGLHYLFWKFKYLTLILVLLSFNNKYSLSVFLLIVFPYFLIWSLFFVADNRNFVMVSPFLGFILSVGLINLIDFLKLLNAKIFKYTKIIVIITFFVLSVFAINIIKNDSDLISKSIEDKKLRGNPEINTLLYSALNFTSPNVDVFYIADSSYNYLPTIGDKFIRKGCNQFYDLIKKDIKDKTFYLLHDTNYCSFDDLLSDYKNFYKINKIFNYKNFQFYLFEN
tara:strand:+ start:143 stop:1921 length:1779 start_codon:yes stop_codon:yes gene_type:complete